MRFRTVRAAGVAVAISIGLLSAPAGAGGGEPWYFAQQGVDVAHAAGVRGEGIKVAILDTQLNPTLPEFADADVVINPDTNCWDIYGVAQGPTYDKMGADHGTLMAALIVGDGQGVGGQEGIYGVAPDVTLLYSATMVGAGTATCNAANPDDLDATADQERLAISEALRWSLDQGANIISGSWVGSMRSPEIHEQIVRALREGVILVSGGLNTDSPGPESGLGSMNGGVLVERFNSGGELVGFGLGKFPTSDLITVVSPGEPMRAYQAPIIDGPTQEWGYKEDAEGGNSSATAITSGLLALVWSKYPDATGNQILQSLIRNTDGGEHEPYYDPENHWGYGPIDLTQMLSVDPTKYPDVNPLLKSGESAPYPPISEIYPAGRPSTATSQPGSSATTTAPAPTPTLAETVPSTSAAPSDTGGASTAIVIAAGAALIVLATVIVQVVAARRRSGAGIPGPPTP